MYTVNVSLKICRLRRPVERGEEGKVFPGPATFGGPTSIKNTEKVFQMASFWPQICIKSIFDRGLRYSPRHLVGWWGDTLRMFPPFPSFGVSISAHAHTDSGCVIHVVALDGHALTYVFYYTPYGNFEHVYLGHSWRCKQSVCNFAHFWMENREDMKFCYRNHKKHIKGMWML